MAKPNASAGVRNTGAVIEPGRPADPRVRQLRPAAAAAGVAVRQFVLIGCYLAAGIAATWPWRHT
jgi:hypothetical protein